MARPLQPLWKNTKEVGQAMNTVLIVDDEENFLSHIEIGLAEFKDYFSVLTAKDGKQAAEILQSSFVDLVVTDLRMPEMDGFELLAFIASNFATIPVIVMTAFGTPEAERQLKATGILSMIEKPINLEELAESIIEGLETAAEEGVLTGVSLDSFVQLIEMEQKTCVLEVHSKAGDMEKCLLLFGDGELYDAAWGELKGEEAAHEIIGLKDVQIRFKKLSRGRKLKRRIEKPLMSILMEATRLRDEADEKQEGEAAGKQENENSGESVSDELMPLDEELLLDDLVLNDEELALDDDDDDEEEDEELDDDEYEKELDEGELDEDELDGKKNEIPEQDSEPTSFVSSSAGEINFSKEDEPSSAAEKKPSGHADEAELEASDTKKPKGGNQMAIKDILNEMAGEIDNLVATGVQGMDGVELASLSPVNASTQQFAARFAMVMKLEMNICRELGDQFGDLEENIMQTENVFVYTCMLGPHYYLGVAISKEGTLGMVRMVAQKYAPKFKAELV